MNPFGQDRGLSTLRTARQTAGAARDAALAPPGGIPARAAPPMPPGAQPPGGLTQEAQEQPGRRPPADPVEVRAAQLRPLFQAAEQQHGIPSQLLEAIAYRESRFNPQARNPDSGATGLMQFMPETAAALGIDPRDPVQSVDGAARYLTQLHNRFGDWRMAIAAYHAGQGNVAKAVQKFGPHWLENGGEFRLGPVTKDYVAEMEPIIAALEAQPIATTAGLAGVPPTPSTGVSSSAQSGVPTRQPALPPEREQTPWTEPGVRRHPVNPLREQEALLEAQLGMPLPSAIKSLPDPWDIPEEWFQPGTETRMGERGRGWGLLTGTMNLVEAGLGTMEMLTGSELVGSVRDHWAEHIEREVAKLRPQVQRERLMRWADRGPNSVWANPTAIWTQFVEQFPNAVATMVPAIAAGRLAAGGGAIGRMFGAGRGVAPGVRAGAAGATAGAFSEAGIVAGFAFNDIKDGIAGAEHADLMASPRYRELYAELGEAGARRKLTMEVGRVNSALAGINSAVLAGMAGTYFGRLFGVTRGGTRAPGFGAAVKARAGDAARGFAVEGLTEAPQEAMEEYFVNRAAIQTHDPTLNPYEGMTEAAVAGGVLGGLTGGLFGGVLGGRRARAKQPPAPPPDTAIPPPGAGPTQLGLPGIDPAGGRQLDPTTLVGQPEQGAFSDPAQLRLDLFVPEAPYETTPAVQDVRTKLHAISPLFLSTYDELMKLTQANLKRRATALGVSSAGTKAEIALRLMQEAVAIIDPELDISGITLAEPTTTAENADGIEAHAKPRTAAQKLADVVETERQEREFPEAAPETSTTGQLAELRRKDAKGFEPLRQAIVAASEGLGEQADVPPVSGRVRATSKLAGWLDGVDRVLGDQYPDVFRKLRQALAEGDTRAATAALQELTNRHQAESTTDIPLTTNEAKALRSARAEAEAGVTQLRRDRHDALVKGKDGRASLITRRPRDPVTGKSRTLTKSKQAAALGSYARALQRAIAKAGVDAPANVMRDISRAIRYNERVVASEVSQTSQPPKKQTRKLADTKLSATQGVSEKVAFSRRNLAEVFETLRNYEETVLQALAEQETKRKPATPAVAEADIGALEQDVRTRPASKLFRLKEAQLYLKESLALAGQYVRLVREEIARRHAVIKDKQAAVDREFDTKEAAVKDKYLGKPIRGVRRAKVKDGAKMARRELDQLKSERAIAKGKVVQQYAADVTALGQAAESLDAFVNEIQAAREAAETAKRRAKMQHEGTPTLAGTSQIIQGAGVDTAARPRVPEQASPEELAAREAARREVLDAKRAEEDKHRQPLTAEEKAATRERVTPLAGTYQYASVSGKLERRGLGVVLHKKPQSGQYVAEVEVNTQNALVLNTASKFAISVDDLIDALNRAGVRIPPITHSTEAARAGQLRAVLRQLGIDVLVLGRGSTLVVVNPDAAKVSLVMPSDALATATEHATKEARRRFVELLQPHNRRKRNQLLKVRKATDILRMLKAFGLTTQETATLNKDERIKLLLDHIDKYGINPLPRQPTAAEQRAFDEALPTVALEPPPAATMTVEETRSEQELSQEESILKAIAEVAELAAAKKELDRRRAEATTEGERQVVDAEYAAFMSHVARQYYDERRATPPKEVTGTLEVEAVSAQNVTKNAKTLAEDLGLVNEEEAGTEYAQMIRDQVMPEFNTVQWRILLGFVNAVKTQGDKYYAQFQKLAERVALATSNERLALAKLRLDAFLDNINGLAAPADIKALVHRFVQKNRDARLRALETVRTEEQPGTITKAQRDWLNNLPPVFRAELIEMGILTDPDLMDLLHGGTPVEVQRAINDMQVAEAFDNERVSRRRLEDTDPTTENDWSALYQRVTLNQFLREALHARLNTSAIGKLAPDTVQWLQTEADAMMRLRSGEASFSLHELLSRMQAEINQNKGNHLLGNALLSLIDRLVSLNLDVEVKIKDRVSIDGDSAGISGVYLRRLRTIELAVDPTGEIARTARAPEGADIASLLHTLLHESVHAATVDRLLSDVFHYGDFNKEIHDLRVALVDAMDDRGWLDRPRSDTWRLTDKFFEDTGLADLHVVRREAMQTALYGITHNAEFVAEVFTNAELQSIMAALDAPAEAKQPKRTLWQRFLNALATAFFGPRYRPEQMTMLEWAVGVTGRAFQKEQQVRKLHVMNNALTKMYEQAYPLRTPTAEAVHAALDNSRQTVWGHIKGWARRGNLGLMDLDFMDRAKGELFDKAVKLHGRIVGNVNPLKQYIAATHRAMGYARDVQARAAKLVRATYELAPEVREKLGELERDSTIAGIFPDVALNHPANAHNFRNQKTADGFIRVPKAGVEAQYAQLRSRWLALKASGAASLYTQRHQLNRELFVRRMTESINLLGRKYGFNKGQLALLQNARTTLQVGKLIDSGKLPVDEKAKAEFLKRHKDIRAATIEGPYFHLHREGNYFVTTTDGDKQYTAQWRNETLAKQDMARLIASGRKAVVSRKLTSGVLGQALQSTVADILMHIPHEGILDGDARAAFKQTLEAALVSVLAENSLIESARMQRKSVEGVRGADMISGYGDYVAAATYAIGDLATMHEISESLKAMNQLQRADNYETPISTDEVLHIGEIVDELKLRLKQNAAHRDVSAMERGAAAIGFYGFLGSPAYWILNATQTAVVGLPVLAGRVKDKAGRSVGMIAAAGALTKAWREIADLAGDGRLLDVDAFIAAVRAKHGDAKADVIQKMLEDGTISSNFAQEITDLTRKFKGSVPTVWKLLSVFEDMPKRIEHFNRISMAWAASDLGANYETARDVTRESQFMYDPANRARLLRFAPMWAGGGLRAIITPVMMFKVFGINMARVLYGNVIDSINTAKTPQQRLEAIRIAAGLIFTHTMAGGLLGGTSLGIIQVLGAAFNSMLDDENKVDWGLAVQDFLANNMGEYAANVAMKGLPAAAGIDLSASINLGNLLWMSQGDIDLSQRGGWERLVYSFTGPVARHLGDTAQYSARYLQGEATTAELLSRAVPLKLAKGTFRAFTMAEGLKSGDQIFARPADIGIPAYMFTALGFRSARVSQLQQRHFGDRNADRNLEQGKQKLLREAAIAQTFDERLKARRRIQKWNERMSRRGNAQLLIQEEAISRSKVARDELQRQYDQGNVRKYN